MFIFQGIICRSYCFYYFIIHFIMTIVNSFFRVNNYNPLILKTISLVIKVRCFHEYESPVTLSLSYLCLKIHSVNFDQISFPWYQLWKFILRWAFSVKYLILNLNGCLDIFYSLFQIIFQLKNNPLLYALHYLA